MRTVLSVRPNLAIAAAIASILAVSGTAFATTPISGRSQTPVGAGIWQPHPRTSGLLPGTATRSSRRRPASRTRRRAASSVTQASGFVVVPASSEGYAEGTPVTVHCYGEECRR